MSQIRRTPDEVQQGLNPLSVLPVFFKLDGKKAIVAGGSDGAAWKAELLAACGARVHVFAETPGEKLQTVAAAAGVEIVRRAWQAADLAGAAIAIGDLESSAEIAEFRAAARSASAPVNIIDKPAQSDFQFGAIVERSPLVIGISTDGGAPVFGQAIRTRIETLLPDGIRRWAAAAKSWRGRIAEFNLDLHMRRRVWELFARKALGNPERAPADEDLRAMLDVAGSEALSSIGSVALVGAGPGDPELLTLKAVRALQSADVVLYDDLVSPAVVAMARRESTKLSVGKRGFKPSCTQEDITAMLVEYARAGKRVVRLKGGDPMVFGRAAEELEPLEDAGIPVEVIPGVTAASAASSLLRRSLTERVRSRRLQFVTAHARNGQLPEDLDWRALSDPKATSVVYMGVRTLPALVERLMREGMAADTPAAIVERASWPGERAIMTTLGALPRVATDAGVGAPALVIIGAVLQRDPPCD